MVTRRQCLSSLAAAAVALVPGAARAQAYPSRPIRIIVPFGAGGPADIYARYLGEKLQPALGQPFVIENRPGGGSVVGTHAAARAGGDGYTLLMMSNTHTANETLLANKPFELMRDFVAVAPVNIASHVLVVHPSVPARTLAELIALAKAQPGKLTYASSGPGTPYHIAGEQFKSMAGGLDILHVPYRGSGEARTDVIGGQVNMMFDSITTQVQNIQTGRVRGLATTGTRRSAQLPDLPTVAEAGVPGYTSAIWLGIMAPAGTPAAVVARLNQEIGRVVSVEATRALWARQAVEPMVMSPAEFERFLRADIEAQRRTIRAANIRVQ